MNEISDWISKTNFTFFVLMFVSACFLCVRLAGWIATRKRKPQKYSIDAKPFLSYEEARAAYYRSTIAPAAVKPSEHSRGQNLQNK